MAFITSSKTDESASKTSWLGAVVTYSIIAMALAGAIFFSTDETRALLG